MQAFKKSISAVFDHISECMALIIPLVLAGGILKIIVLLFTALHVLSGTTEVILSAIATAPFYFLPVTVAYSAAVHFGADPFLAIGSVCVMLLPDFAELMESGERVTFAGLPVLSATYAYSVIPIILLIWCMSHIERFFKRLIKESLQPYFLAVCVVFLTSLLGILAVEPLVSLISGALADSLDMLQTQAPVVAWAVLAGLITMLVSTGMHWIFITLAITQIGLTGVDYGIMPAFLVSNASLAGCDVGVFLKAKYSEKKAMAASALLAVLFPGISEPSIFGVLFKEKTPLISNVLGCMIGGAVQGLLTVHCYVFAFPSIPAFLMFYSAQEAANIGKAALAAGVSFAVTLMLTLLIYSDRKSVGEQKA